MDSLPGTSMFCVARYTHSNTAPGHFNQFNNLDSAPDPDIEASSPIIDASIGPRGRDEYCDDDDDDGDNKNDSDVDDISALLDSAPTVVKKPNDL